MSGVDVSDNDKNIQVHVCESCMNTVVQTFSHLQEQIVQLNLTKTKLQIGLDNAKKEQKEQKRIMRKEIRVLEEKLAALKKSCFREK